MAAKTQTTLIEQKVSNLLKQMSLEEKVGQMTQVDFSVIGAGPNSEEIDPAKLEIAVAQHHVGSILNAPGMPDVKARPLETWRKITVAIRAASEKTQLKIPVIYGIDAIHGATYTENATLFPQAINMAATFNTELAYQEGEITAREVKASGLDWNFYPVLDVGRQPLWPRFWETFGEDVYLASALGESYIRGHQGDNFAAPDKAPTCLKHYVGYSYPLNGKDRTPAWIGERALRELFLPSFASGVLAGSPTVMVNSSEVDGVPGHANHYYLNDILRGELGFTGFTISDWEDVNRLYTRDKLAASQREAVKMAVMAGVDMSMAPFDFSFPEILADLVKKGEVPMSRIDEAVGRILTVKFRSGLFDKHPLLDAKQNFATPEAAKINRQAAIESIVLAKNENKLLPLAKSSRVLVTGPTANLLSALNGGWTITWQGDREDLYPADKLTLAAALRQKNPDHVTFLGGGSYEHLIKLDEAVNAAAQHDAVVLALGEKPYAETLGNIDSLQLPEHQLALGRALLATGKPVILVYLGGRPRIITELAEKAAAVIVAMLPGMEGGPALADILYGDANPSGRLPFSYPRATNGITAYDYKAMENFDGASYQPLYPFGHGLGYSRIVVSDLHVSKPVYAIGEPVQVSVKVGNAGERAAKESVLLYVNDVAASVSRPNKQLKAFQKVELNPGQEKTVQFTLGPDALSFIGLNLRRVTEPGDFKVYVGDLSAGFALADKPKSPAPEKSAAKANRTKK